MFNLFKYIIIIIIVYVALRFIQKIMQNIKLMNTQVKGQAKSSFKNDNDKNIEDADFEDIE